MIEILLPDNFYNCPKHWQNMIHHIEQIPDEGVTSQEINDELKRFNARYQDSNKDIAYIKFADEAGYIMYMLTYG